MKLIVVTFLLTLTQAFSQLNILDVSLTMNRKTYLSYEHVYGVVTITNRGGKDLRLHNQGGDNWLNFSIQRNQGKEVPMAKKFLFKDCVIPAGKAVSRKVVLTQLYPLIDSGNYTIRAKVKPPEGNEIYRSSPSFFSVFNGVDLYRQQHAVTASGGQIVEYRITKLIDNNNNTSLYFQSYDPKRRKMLVTYSIGGYTGLRDVQVKIDGSGYLHTLYPTDAKLYRYLNITNTGKILDQRIVKLGSRGQPMLVPLAGGRISIRNGLAYDPEEQAEKLRAIHNISQRPPFSYK